MHSNIPTTNPTTNVRQFMETPLLLLLPETTQ